MQTNQENWLENGQKDKGKSKKPLYLILSIVLVLAVGASGLYYYLLNSGKEETPPTLDLATMQGFIGTGIYMEFDDSDISASENKSFPKEVNAGVQILYSSSETSLRDIVDSIKPDKSLKIMFAYYNESLAKFEVFPKGPYANTNLINANQLSQYKVPANRGFFLIANKKFNVSSALKTYNEAPTISVDALKTQLNNYPSVSTGSSWRLLITTPENLNSACGSRVKSSFFTKAPDANGVSFVKYPSNISRVGYAVWVNLQNESGSCVAGAPSTSGQTGGQTGGQASGQADLSQIKTLGSSLNSGIVTMLTDAESILKEVEEAIKDFERPIIGELSASTYLKASTFNIESPIQIQPIKQIDLNDLKTEQQIQIDKLQDITTIKTISKESLLNTLFGAEDGMLESLFGYKDRIEAEVKIIRSANTSSNLNLTALNSATNLDKANEYFEIISAQYAKASDAKEIIDERKLLFESMLPRYLAVIGVNPDDGEIDVSNEGDYSDPKFNISLDSINSNWLEFTICMAENRKFSVCSGKLPINSNDGNFDKIKNALNFCASDSFKQNGSNLTGKELYECLNTWTSIYLSSSLKSNDIYIIEGHERYLVINDQLSYCNQILNGTFLDDGNYYCDGNKWTKVEPAYNNWLNITKCLWGNNGDRNKCSTEFELIRTNYKMTERDLYEFTYLCAEENGAQASKLDKYICIEKEIRKMDICSSNLADAKIVQGGALCTKANKWAYCPKDTKNKWAGVNDKLYTCNNLNIWIENQPESVPCTTGLSNDKTLLCFNGSLLNASEHNNKVKEKYFTPSANDLLKHPSAPNDRLTNSNNIWHECNNTAFFNNEFKCDTGKKQWVDNKEYRYEMADNNKVVNKYYGNSLSGTSDTCNTNFAYQIFDGQFVCSQYFDDWINQGSPGDKKDQYINWRWVENTNQYLFDDTNNKVLDAIDGKIYNIKFSARFWPIPISATEMAQNVKMYYLMASNISQGYNSDDIKFIPFDENNQYGTYIQVEGVNMPAKHLFYCGKDFLGLVSPSGFYACSYDGSKYKIIDLQSQIPANPFVKNSEPSVLNYSDLKKYAESGYLLKYDNRTSCPDSSSSSKSYCNDPPVKFIKDANKYFIPCTDQNTDETVRVNTDNYKCSSQNNNSLFKWEKITLTN